MKSISAIVFGAVVLAAGAAVAADQGKPLDEAACNAQWTMASPNGDALAKDKATPYVINYTMVDSDKDGQISADEFKAGCAGGNIKAADDATVKDMQ